MKRVLVLIAASVLFVAAYGQSSKKEIQEKKDHALLEMQIKIFSGLQDSAQILTDAYRKMYGNDAMLVRVLALGDLATGNFEGAIKKADESLAMNKKDKSYKDLEVLYYIKSIAYREMGNYTMALVNIDLALKEDKNDLNYNGEKINLHCLMGDYGKALDVINRLEKKQPDNLSIQLTKAQVYRVAGREIEYQQTLDKVIQQAPEYTDARVEKLRYLAGNGDYKGAFDQYLEICKEQTDNNTQNMLNNFSDYIYDYEMEKLSEVINVYRKQEEKESMQEWMLRVVNIDTYKGNFDKALNGLKEVDKTGINDTSYVMYFYLVAKITYHEQKEDYDNLLIDFNQFGDYLTKTGNELDEDFYHAKGEIYNKLDQPEKAIECYETVVEQNGESASASILLELAELYIKTKKTDKGIERFSKTIDRYGEIPVVIYHRGEALLRLKNDTAAAFADFNKVLEIDTVPAYNSMRHFALMLMGKTAEAEEWMKKVEEAGDLGEGGKWMNDYNFACAYALVGMKEKAIERLMGAVEKGFSDCKGIEEDDDFDPIRECAEFKSIMKVICSDKE